LRQRLLSGEDLGVAGAQIGLLLVFSRARLRLRSVSVLSRAASASARLASAWAISVGLPPLSRLASWSRAWLN